MERASLSQSIYLEIRLRFLDRFKLPAVMHVTAENKRHRPIVTEYQHGVKAPLQQCLSMTLSERLQLIDLSSLDSQVQIAFKFNWGLDGSGEHSNYHQLSKVNYSTKQVMSVCFALREVTVNDTKGKIASWTSTDKGANKPQNVRPMALFPAKETKELLVDFIPIVEEEIAKIKADGVEVKVENREEVIASCEGASLTMADGKMVTTLLQLGGAYCTMCSKTLMQCHKKDIIEGRVRPL